MFRNQAKSTKRFTETIGLFVGFVLRPHLPLLHCCKPQGFGWIFLCLAITSLGGCKTLSLPAIDPTGNRIFSSGQTTLVSPHDPSNGYPSQQPAFQAPPKPPACMQGADGSEKKLCKGCLAGKGCLGNRKEAEEVRGRCGQLLLTPTRIVAPVGGEVILLVGVCGQDGNLVTNEPIEFMLSPKSVGEFVAVGDDSKGQRRSLWRKEDFPKVEKLGVDFARGRTSREASNITRGTSSKSDDLPIRKGQTWISLTSPSEGISKVTVLAPDSDVWDQRRQTATIYWEDAAWQFPQVPPNVLSGETARLITRVTRAEGLIPAEGWRVRYRVLNPEIARFVFQGREGDEVVDVVVDKDGIAAVGIVNGQQAPHGTAMVEIEVIRPARADDNIPELPLGRETITVTWSAAELQLNVGGPEIAVPGQPLGYFATVANTGDLNAENVVVSVVVPPGMVLQSPNIAPTSQANGALAWELGPLMPRRAFDISFNLVAQAAMDAQVLFEATGSPNLRQQKPVRTLVQQPQVTLQIMPRQNANQIEVGGEAVFEILVANTGNQTINNVSVSLQSDPGLQHAQDNQNTLEQVIGFLNPGQSRKLEGVFRVASEGELKVKATVQSLGQVLAAQTASVRGLPATPKRPSLSLQINNISRQTAIPVRGEFSLSWSVANTGPVPLRNPVISMQHSPNLEVVELSRDGSYRVENQLGQWRLPDLQPGRSVELSGRFRALSAGLKSTVEVAVETSDGLGDRKSIAFDIANGSGTNSPGTNSPGANLPGANLPGANLPGANLPRGGEVMPGNPAGGQPGGGLNKPAISLNDQDQKRLSVTIQPVSNSIHIGEVGTYEIRIENLINKPDQRVALSLLTPEGAVLKSIRAKDLQYKLSNKDRQIDLEPIKYFRANDVFSCVLQLRHDEVAVGDLIASVTSMGQTVPVTKSLSIQVLPR